jgi:uncharacterized protein (TIGR03083 family)
MTPTSAHQPSFAGLLALIDDRSTAFRKALAGADPAARVPSCPDWSLRDLVAHLGEVHRFWATVVAAGPADTHPGRAAVGDTTPHGDLAAWSADSTALLLAALEAAGPDSGCWTWWGASGSPRTAGAVARHQVQEATVHTYDAQLTVGRPEPLPASAAVDGIAEFLSVEYGTTGPWPHSPAHVALHAAEGPSWLLALTPTGAALLPQAPASPAPAARLHGTASDLVLTLFRRLPLERLHLTGDRALAEQLLAWTSLD